MPILRAILFAVVVYLISFLGLYWLVGVEVYEEDAWRSDSNEVSSIYNDYGRSIFYVQFRSYARLPVDTYLELKPSSRCLSDWLAYLGGSRRYVLENLPIIEKVGVALHQKPHLQVALHKLMAAQSENQLFKVLAEHSIDDPQLLQLRKIFENAPKDLGQLWIVPTWIGEQSLWHEWLFSNDFNKRLSGAFSILEGAQWSFVLGLLTFTFTSILGLLWGVGWALGSAKAGWQSLSLIIFSIPSFAWALILLWGISLLSHHWYWPMNDPGPLSRLWIENPFEVLYRLSLPAFCLSLVPAAYMAGLWRQSIEKEIINEYVKTARAKGLSESSVLVRHIFKNAAFPAFTASALLLPGMLMGSLVIESLFSIPGLGRLMHLAYLQRDFQTLLWIFPTVTTFIILLWQLMNVIYKMLDPRTQ